MDIKKLLEAFRQSKPADEERLELIALKLCSEFSGMKVIVNELLSPNEITLATGPEMFERLKKISGERHQVERQRDLVE